MARVLELLGVSFYKNFGRFLLVSMLASLHHAQVVAPARNLYAGYVNGDADGSKDRLPVVLWHGMGTVIMLLEGPSKTQAFPSKAKLGHKCL